MERFKKPNLEVLNKYEKFSSKLRKAQTHEERSMYLSEMSRISAHYDLRDKSFKHCGKLGVKDASDNIIIPALFDGICFVGSKNITHSNFCNSIAVIIKNGKYGMLSIDSRFTSPIFDCKSYISVTYNIRKGHIVKNDHFTECYEEAHESTFIY